MPGRELEATKDAVRHVIELGWSPYEAAQKFRMSPSALYRAVKRKKPRFFAKKK